jgi:tripartite ATP-independent transporter DctM subunit
VSIEVITLVTVGLLVFLISSGVPLAFATGGTAAIMALTLFGPDSLLIVVSRVHDMMGNYVLLAVPLFIFMGCILEKGGVAEQLFRVMHIWAGPIRGGLAVGAILSGTVLSAMIGIVGAEIVTLGLVALPEMLRRGYDREISLGTISAGGSLGTMMPPSIVLIIYGLIANVSIAKLFMAAIVPALLLASFYIAYIVVRCYFQPHLAPPATDAERAIPLIDKILLVRELVLPIGIIAGVMGSLYLGIATPTEAASIGVAGALAAAAVNGKLNWLLVRDSLVRTGFTVGTVTWIFYGANSLVSVYNFAGGITYLKDLVGGIDLAPIMVVAIMMGILIILGMFIDWIGIALLTMPVFVPIIEAYGMDPIWFGILFCMNMQISYLSPPFGPAGFYLKSVTPPEITLGDIFRSVWPFVILQVLAMAIVLVWPDVALWLPSDVR